MNADGGDGVREAADLARLPPPGIELLAHCRRVVDAFANLPPAPDVAAPPLRAIQPGDTLRDDEPQAGLTTEEVLAAAPDAVDDTFRVPRVRDVQ